MFRPTTSSLSAALLKRHHGSLPLLSAAALLAARRNGRSSVRSISHGRTTTAMEVRAQHVATAPTRRYSNDAMVCKVLLFIEPGLSERERLLVDEQGARLIRSFQGAKPDWHFEFTALNPGELMKTLGTRAVENVPIKANVPLIRRYFKEEGAVFGMGLMEDIFVIILDKSLHGLHHENITCMHQNKFRYLSPAFEDGSYAFWTNSIKPDLIYFLGRAVNTTNGVREIETRVSKKPPILSFEDFHPLAANNSSPTHFYLLYTPFTRLENLSAYAAFVGTRAAAAIVQHLSRRPSKQPKQQWNETPSAFKKSPDNNSKTESLSPSTATSASDSPVSPSSLPSSSFSSSSSSSLSSAASTSPTANPASSSALSTASPRSSTSSATVETPVAQAPSFFSSVAKAAPARPAAALKTATAVGGKGISPTTAAARTAKSTPFLQPISPPLEVKQPFTPESMHAMEIPVSAKSLLEGALEAKPNRFRKLARISEATKLLAVMSADEKINPAVAMERLIPQLPSNCVVVILAEKHQISQAEQIMSKLTTRWILFEIPSVETLESDEPSIFDVLSACHVGLLFRKPATGFDMMAYFTLARLPYVLSLGLNGNVQPTQKSVARDNRKWFWSLPSAVNDEAPGSGFVENENNVVSVGSEIRKLWFNDDARDECKKKILSLVPKLLPNEHIEDGKLKCPERVAAELGVNLVIDRWDPQSLVNPFKE